MVLLVLQHSKFGDVEFIYLLRVRTHVELNDHYD